MSLRLVKSSRMSLWHGSILLSYCILQWTVAWQLEQCCLLIRLPNSSHSCSMRNMSGDNSCPFWCLNILFEKEFFFSFSFCFRFVCFFLNLNPCHMSSCVVLLKHCYVPMSRRVCRANAGIVERGVTAEFSKRFSYFHSVGHRVQACVEVAGAHTQTYFVLIFTCAKVLIFLTWENIEFGFDSRKIYSQWSIFT